MSGPCIPHGGGGQEAARRLLALPSARIHLMGAGGIGMSGLARLLQVQGCRVTGCNEQVNEQVTWLRGHGIPVAEGHGPDHVQEIDGLVHTTAVPVSHPELQRAREAGCPVIRRGEMLAALVNARPSIAVAGAHGKTTTTAMISQILRASGVDAAFCVGGFLRSLGGVAGGGTGVLVVEADESDGTLVEYEARTLVLTNADLDHVEHFGDDEEALWTCYRRAISQAGRVWFGADDSRLTAWCAGMPGARSFGFAQHADVRGSGLTSDFQGCAFDVACDGLALGRLELPVPGRFNALNALAATGVALQQGLTFGQVRRALRHFVPADRRLQRVGLCGGAVVYTDYAHHPAEIKALIGALASYGGGRLHIIFQPHRYTRTLRLGADFPPAFAGAASIMLVPVYAASEAPLPGGTSLDLQRRFEQAGLPVAYAGSLEEAWQRVQGLLAEGDLLLLLGAGDVVGIADWVGTGTVPAVPQGETRR